MNKINREDMLELTRRMTRKRNCFSRIAGAYMDEEGFIEGTFNTHFLKLSPAEQEEKLAAAKAIPFSSTNVQLREVVIPQTAKGPDTLWSLLMGLRECELKNDGLLDVFYEMFGERYPAVHPYAVCFFSGSYDVPRKAADKERLEESEEVYSFLICSVCPVYGDYQLGQPEYGFLFPAFKDRSQDLDRVNVFQSDPEHPFTGLF
ncbi:MAG: DUF4317 family protein [Eubacteriales bacterium]|nr:DUF4317 family protein [Eubacteriales bacterium]